MGVRNASVSGVVPAGNVTLVTTTEAAAIILPPLNIPLDNSQVFILAMLGLQSGTAVTAMTLRVRQGSGITGTILGTGYSYIIGASANGSACIFEIDTPGIVAGQVYTVTVQQVGATGNGAVNAGSCAIAFVL